MSDTEKQAILTKINFEEKWLIDIKMNNGFISIADIEVAMSGIRSVIAEFKGKNEILDLYYGMSESMQKAIKDIMIVTQENRE